MGFVCGFFWGGVQIVLVSELFELKAIDFESFIDW